MFNPLKVYSMKKTAKNLLCLVGIAALIWVTGEPAQINAAWVLGEIAGAVVMVVAFKAAARLEK